MMLHESTTTTGRIAWLGKGVDYNDAWALQRKLVAERAEGRIPDTLLLLEHAPVYTAGHRTLPEHVKGTLNAPLIETDRGGQLTYHGPGQLVGYPIVGLAERHMGPKAYVKELEAALLQTLEDFGVEGHTEDGLTGVWTEKGKIAAIGVKITRGVAMHGFALNITTDLSAYEPIIACGVEDRPTTSMVRHGAAPLITDVATTIAGYLGGLLDVAWEAAEPASL
jgi:lipoyl(octanoyl) transferase